MTEQHLRLGTRGSRLAIWQAERIKHIIESALTDVRVEVVIVRTSGDRDRQSPLEHLGGEGIFTRELENRLLDGDVDLAVHSLKDLPTRLPDGLKVAAVPERGPVEDVLVSRAGRTLEELPPGARVATGSPRRRSLLLSVRPDLEVVGMRGNVPTRLLKLESERLDGIVLARAGLVRLGLEGRISQVLAPERFLPAPGQGAIAVETREDPGPAARAVSVADHPASRLAAEAERGFLLALGGGCQVPIGAWARPTGGEASAGTHRPSGLTLSGMVASTDGSRLVRGETMGLLADAAAMGARLAAQLLEQGAGEVLPSPG